MIFGSVHHYLSKAEMQCYDDITVNDGDSIISVICSYYEVYRIMTQSLTKQKSLLCTVWLPCEHIYFIKAY